MSHRDHIIDNILYNNFENQSVHAITEAAEYLADCGLEFALEETSWPNMEGGVVALSWIEPDGSLELLCWEYV